MAPTILPKTTVPMGPTIGTLFCRRCCRDYLGEAIRWNHAAGFACLLMAAFFAFYNWS